MVADTSKEVREAPKEERENHPAKEKVRRAGGKVKCENRQRKRKNVKGNRGNRNKGIQTSYKLHFLHYSYRNKLPL